MMQRLACNFLEKLFILLKTKAPSKYIYPKSLLLRFWKNALKSAHFTFLQFKKNPKSYRFTLQKNTIWITKKKFYLMETTFSQILFLSIYRICAPLTNSVEKLVLSHDFWKMKNYLKHKSLLIQAKTLITKMKGLWNLADH